MSARRVVVLVTCTAVAALGAVFAVTRWSEADRIATVVSALAAVAALGVAVWAAFPASGDAGRGSGTGAVTGLAIWVSGTGDARSGPGGTANTGLTAPAGALRGTVGIERTGSADASGGGDSRTGVDLT